MKFQQLQKRVIKIGVVCTAIVILLGIGYYFVSNYQDKLVQQIAEEKSKTSANQAQTKIIEKQVLDAKDALVFYNDFNDSGNSDPQNFRRDFAKNLLMKLKDSNNIMDLKFTMDQFTKLGDQYTKPTVAVYSSKVSVPFSAISDIDAYNLIKNISDAFPGDVKILSYNVKKTRDINDENLIQLSTGSLPDGFITGEMTFEWRSIQDNPDYKAKAEGQAPNANAKPRAATPPRLNPLKAAPNG